MTSTCQRLRAAVLDRLPGVRRRARAPRRRIALTFDDGPDALTPRYLAALDALGVPATFFALGAAAARHPEHVRAYLRGGHQVASHGYDHARFPALSTRALLAQCARTEAALGGQATGRAWVRPPHGALDARSLAVLLAARYTVALWSVDSGDHATRDPGEVIARCAPARVRGGDVLLLHEGQPWTLAALPVIVTTLRARGYECVTMQDLFAP